jgi:hypothetical protein
LRGDLDALNRELEAALETIVDFDNPEQAPTEDPLPKYDSLSDWSMTASVTASLEQVSVFFEAEPSVEIQGAQLAVTQNGQEVTTEKCVFRGGQLSASVRLTPADGYEYTLFWPMPMAL